MGFCAPATIVDDAIRHGVEVRPVDVTASAWDCTLEPTDAMSDGSAYAVRMGLRYVKGLSRERDGRRIEAARADQPFASMEDFVRRTQLDERVVRRLVEAGAFARLEGTRRAALWEVLALARTPAASLALAPHEPRPGFEALSALETIAWDYRSTAHSTRGHPLAPLRDALASRGLPDARTVATVPGGRRVRYAGIVICRQRPATASGVTFMTLEDETGLVNVVVWKRVFDAYAVLARTVSFLGVTGRLQCEYGVVHIVAEALLAPQLPARPPAAHARSFR